MSDVNLNIQFSAELTSAQVSQILTKALEAEFGKTVKTITFNLREVSTDSMDRYSRKEFSGCNVTFESGSSNSDNSFGSKYSVQR